MEGFINIYGTEAKLKGEEITSCRPISLLPILFRVFEKIKSKFLKLIIEENKIPNHQLFQEKTQNI